MYWKATFHPNEAGHAAYVQALENDGILDLPLNPEVRDPSTTTPSPRPPSASSPSPASVPSRPTAGSVRSSARSSGATTG